MRFPTEQKSIPKAAVSYHTKGNALALAEKMQKSGAMY